MTRAAVAAPPTTCALQQMPRHGRRNNPLLWIDRRAATAAQDQWGDLGGWRGIMHAHTLMRAGSCIGTRGRVCSWLPMPPPSPLPGQECLLAAWLQETCARPAGCRPAHLPAAAPAASASPTSPARALRCGRQRASQPPGSCPHGLARQVQGCRGVRAPAPAAMAASQAATAASRAATAPRAEIS